MVTQVSLWIYDDRYSIYIYVYMYTHVYTYMYIIHIRMIPD